MSHNRIYAIDDEIKICMTQLKEMDMKSTNTGDISYLGAELSTNKLSVNDQIERLKTEVWFEGGIEQYQTVIKQFVDKDNIIKKNNLPIFGKRPLNGPELHTDEKKNGAPSVEEQRRLLSETGSWSAWFKNMLKDKGYEFASQLTNLELLQILKNTIIVWKIMQDWFSDIDDDLELITNSNNGNSGIMIQSVDFFGPSIGFVKFKAFFKNKLAADAGRKNTTPPGIVFMRSASVAVLPIIIVEDKHERFTILTLQARVSTGKSSFPEIPAGMMDGEDNFIGVAAKEMKEETGLRIEKHEMIDLTRFAYGKKFKGMYPSSGGCNEYLKLFAWEKYITSEEFEEIQTKLKTPHGEEKEGEFITLKMIPFSKLYTEAPDAKALSALALYNIYVKQKAEHYNHMVRQT